MEKPDLTPEDIAAQAGVELAFEAKKAYDAHDPKFHEIAATAGDLMGRGSLGESVVDGVFKQSGSASNAETAQLEPVPTVLTWEQQLEKLSPERRIAAGATREVLVKKYESYGYGADDFSLIPATRTNKDGQVEETFAVALSATQAVDLSNRSKMYDKKRSWDSIDPTKANKQFMVTVNGKEFDERKGVTLEAMRELTALNPEISEWIWETGRPDLAAGHSAPIVRARAGDADRGRDRRDHGSGGIVFRPIVVLE